MQVALDIGSEIKSQLKINGWVHIFSKSEEEANEILNSLGEVIFTTDVVVKPESKSMVTSANGLHLHTDHPKAKYILWYCYSQSDAGGNTILLDLQPIYYGLSNDEKQVLSSIKMREHKVFTDDKDYYPFVSHSKNGNEFYYSYWLAHQNDKDNPVLKKLHGIIEGSPHTKINLKPGDILIIDNKRILHGRTPITGSKNRHLRRYWISENQFYKQTKSLPMNTATLTVPKPISEERINFLMSKRIDADIASIDLEMIKMKLQEPKEGVNWTADQVEDAEIEYKRYLHLTRHFSYPTYSIVPNKIMDTMWHYHILDTRAYHRDCEKTFGHYLHHYPYFGLRGEDDAKNLKTQFENTKEYYLQTFGESMARNREADCWHDCEDRCWHACSDDD